MIDINEFRRLKKRALAVWPKHADPCSHRAFVRAVQMGTKRGDMPEGQVLDAIAIMATVAMLWELRAEK